MKHLFTAFFALFFLGAAAQETNFEAFVTQVRYEQQYGGGNSIYILNRQTGPTRIDVLSLEERLRDVDLMLLEGNGGASTYWDHFKRNIPQKIGMYVFGAGDGIADVIRNKYDRTWLTQYNDSFQQWADPRISWRNKYWQGDPANGPKFFLSNGALVFMTDFWHLAKTIRNTGMRVSMYTYKHPPKGKWQYYAYDFVADLLIMAAGWQTSNLVLQIK